MKTKLFLFRVLFFSIIFFATSISASGDFKGNEQQIKLQGSLGGAIIKSSGVPFEVFLSDYSISISFLQDLKNITIEIVNKSGEEVYYDAVNPVCGQTLAISIAAWDKGIYIITFSDRDGGCVYGDFEL